MTILLHLEDQAVFEPDAITAMAQAFDDACNRLRVFGGDEDGRRTVATRIIDLACDGLLDPAALRDRVINESQASL